MSGRRPVSGVLNSMQPRGSRVYAGAFGRRRAGRTGALGAGMVLAAALAGSGAPAQTPGLPVVTITADTAEVQEGALAQFTIRRTGSTTPILEGSLYVTGANPALDYPDGHAFAFRLGEASKAFQVPVLDDGTAATDRQVSVRVDHLYDTYTAGTPSSATMTVIDTTPAVVTPTPVVVPEPPEAFRLGVPGSAVGHLQALGNRTQIEGREQSVYDGTWASSARSSVAVRLIHQLPRLVRVEGAGGPGSVLVFDGSQVRSKVAVLTADEQLMETLVHDTQEGFLYSVREGGFRVVGYRFGAGAGATTKYDVFEVAVPVETAIAKPLRIKWFYFDSNSGLLAKTTYQERGYTVEARFSSWGEVAGSMYPGMIERFEAGNRVFALTAMTLSVGPGTETTVFENPNAEFRLDGETP